MHRLQLHYTLSSAASPARVRNPLLDLLQAVHAQGSISAAARTLGLSYRHVWGELKRWEGELGQALVLWDKGQAARLTPFATKLLWAEGQAQARLAPQIAALQAELERAFAVAFDPAAQVATLYASHDDALAALLALAPSAGLHLDIRFCGSVDAIRALNEGRCVLAGFHTQAQPPGDSLAAQVYKPLLQPGQHKIIGFAQRAQGLIVAPGNPLQLHSLADVARRGARLVQREHGSGTRLLQQELLAQAGLSEADVQMCPQSETSHTAVAHAVASAQADAALGIAVAAQRQGLDFVPLLRENYYLVCLKSALEQPPVRALLGLLQGAHWQAQLAQIAGYTPQHCGQVLSLRQTLPWWQFARRKPHHP